MFSSVLVLLRGCDVHICWDDFYNLGVGDAVASAVFRTRVVIGFGYVFGSAGVLCVCVVCCELFLDVG